MSSINGKLRSVLACAVAGAFVLGGGLCGAGCSREEDRNVVSYVAVETKALSTTADVVDAVADSVVEISTESVTTQWGMQYIVSGAGSGVIIGRDTDNDKYYIVTNYHVIENAKDVKVTLRSGKLYRATVVASDIPGDIAVVSVAETAELNVATWGNSDALRIGEDLIAIGNPLGNLGGTVTKGILSATERAIAVRNYPMSLLQTDTAINPGNSGGGLFNMRGELIGIVNAKKSDEEIEGICFAIPGNVAKSACDDLIKLGYVSGRAGFGITVTTANIGNIMQQQTILYVTDAGSAEGGTFMRYDRIAAINGADISSLLDYNTAMSKVKPGDSVEVTVYRGTANQFGQISFSSETTTFRATAQQLM